MNKIYSVLCILLMAVSGCFSVEFQPFKGEMPDLTIGGWQLTLEWEGYMGSAVKLNANKTFDYWSYSDVKMDDEPKYPIHGTWSIEEGVLNLTTNDLIYDKKFYPMVYNGIFCLFPESSYKRLSEKNENGPDYSRIHFQNIKFDPAEPHSGRIPYKIKEK